MDECKSMLNTQSTESTKGLAAYIVAKSTPYTYLEVVKTSAHNLSAQQLSVLTDLHTDLIYVI